jgi:hypothetical protein
VKICSLYGAGFYYIPGTDMCLKIGGWVRSEYLYGFNGSTVTTTVADVNNRGTHNSVWRSRGYITADARNQTEYGTVRSYIAVGLNTTSTGTDSGSNTFSANRAFLQWAGFTFGLAQSFYDFYSPSAVAYTNNYPDSDTGDSGWQVAAYTAQFGNGFSATIGAEMRRMSNIINAGPGTTAAIVGSGAGYGGFNAPDIVGNLRVDQAWGSAQVMGALHEVNANYYNNATTGVTLENSGHPSDKWGFAVGAGIKLNAPMIGPGDYFQAQVNYTQGATRYAFHNPNGNWYIQNGQQAAYGILSDAVYGGTIAGGTASDLQLTTSWGVNASYEHFWNSQWKTSLHGGYAQIDYGSQANAMLCVQQGQGVGTGVGSTAVAAAGCDNNWNTWWIGSRTQWNVTKDFYMGLDVVYIKLQGASSATGLVPGNVIPGTTATTNIATTERDNWTVRYRVHKDFYP